MAERTLPAEETAESIFVIPAQTVPRKMDSRGEAQIPAQALIFTARGVLHILADDSPGQPAQANYLRADQLLYTRLTLVLLYGELEFYGVADNNIQQISVRYNGAGHALLQPALQRFLRDGWEQKPAAPGTGQTQALLQTLEAQSYKFRNGLTIFAMQPAEQLLDFVFQPRIQQKIWLIFQRLVAPAALLALTDRQLLLVEEGCTSATQYGWYITFCPRDCVSRVEIAPNAAWQDVRVHLSKENATAEFRVMLDNPAVLAWQSLWSEHAG